MVHPLKTKRKNTMFKSLKATAVVDMLKVIAENAKATGKCIPFHNCNARYYPGEYEFMGYHGHATTFISYKTLVGVVLEGTMYCFGKYSLTTTQQCRRFARENGVNIVYTQDFYN